MGVTLSGMPNSPDLSHYPLCRFFLSGYLSVREDPTNFPSDEQPALFDRYENIFKFGLDALSIPKESLRQKPEFNFDSGNPANLESGIGVLRTIEALRQMGFHRFAIPKSPGADILCEKGSQPVCCEVKTITKQSTLREGFYFVGQVYEKVFENVDKARDQLLKCKSEIPTAITLYISVSNWFDQAIYLLEKDYQRIVNRLEKETLEGGDLRESLHGIDGILFLTKAGHRCLFLNERGKTIDC